MVKNIAMMGDSESVKGYEAVGFDVYVCDDPAKAQGMLHSIVEEDRYAAIFMTEELFEASKKEREKILEKTIPAVIPLIGARGNTGIGKKRLSAFVEQAVGSDILFKN